MPRRRRAVSHVTFEDLVAYFAGDHPNEASIEDHLFACEACTREGERVAAVTEAIRAEIPHVLDRARLAGLHARGLRTSDTFVQPDQRIEAEFSPNVDLLIHHLGGVDLTTAERVEVIVRVESDQRVLSHIPQVPFDRDAGEILIACQRRFSEFPPDTEMEVRVHARGVEKRHRYAIMHHFVP
jgi:hypothetical protein